MKTCILILFLAVFAPRESHAQEDHREVKSNNKENAEHIPKAGTTGDANDSADDGKAKTPQTPLHKYKYLFTQHRQTQLEAVKRIVSIDSNEKKYELINMMLNQLFKTVEEAKQNVTTLGFLPGDPFPENITVLEGVTKILENTALFGDIVLRLPDIVHDLYDRKKEWQLLLAWSYGFCMQSEVFEGPNLQLLSLMAQEVDIIPQDPNYFNPFKAVNQEKMKNLNLQNVPIPTMKQKRRRQRGPRMGRSEL